MTHSVHDRVIALAALFQAAWLTDHIAYHGSCNETELDATLGSLYAFDAPDVAAIFGGVAKLRPGLDIIRRVLGNEAGQDDLRLTRYIVALIGHAGRLRKDPGMLEDLRQRLERSAQQKTHFEGWDAPVLAGLADVYVNTVGTFQPRIMVKGDPQRLQDPAVVNRVRATLLGGIRAAVLWQQTGGRRWQLVFQRGKLRSTTQALLAESA